MAEIEVKERKLKTLLKYFSKAERDDKKFCFILGAGASKQSGIPTGGELAKRWLKELDDLYEEDEIREWVAEERIDRDNPATCYSAIYDKRFELDKEDGYFALEKVMKGAQPSCGYSVLAQVLVAGKHNIVITTNFDSLMEDAMFIYTDKRPLVCGHEALAGFIRPMETRPLIAKIHRDLFLGPKSTSDETEELEEGWVKALRTILGIYTPIVIGYGGNDGSLMGFLEQLDNIEGKMFWCYREADGLGNHRIKELINKHDGFAVAIEGFDEMMVQLNGLLGYKLLHEDELVSIARDRAKRYRKQIEDIQKKGPSEETCKALDKTIEQSRQDWWTVELLASKETDADKKEEIYKKGLEEYPDSYELMCNYALFFHNIRKDYDGAEKYYKKALKLDPDGAINLGNYALFLENIRKEYGKAEEYYKKTLELDPEQANHAGNYADFLERIHKDYDQAEEYYKKALDIDPEHVIHTGNYASFLTNIRKDYEKAEEYYKKALECDANNAYNTGNYAKLLIEKDDMGKAEEYIDKAFSLATERVDLLVILWFYRYAIFWDKYEEAYENVVKLVRSGARPAGSYLKEVIKVAEKRGHPDVERLRKFDRIITEDESVDILDD